MTRRRNQSGQVLVLVAVALLALIGSAALVLLAGSAASQRNQLQSLADTASLDSALKIGIGCDAAMASTVITEADNFLATQRTRTGSLAIAAGTCATPYHGTDAFAGGLSADYYYPYRAHQQQVEVLLTLTLPISFGGAVGATSTTLSRYAVAQALPASVPAIQATTLSCTGGQVNAVGDVVASNPITLSGGCALYAHQNSTSGAYSRFGNVRAYTDGQAWTGVGGSCSAGANSGSTDAICADGYELSGHVAMTCGGATQFLSAANAAVNANPCAAGVGSQPVPPLPSTLPPDPNADPAAIATLQGTGGSACTSGGVYPAIVAGGITWGTGLAPAPTKDANGFWHLKPSCYGYLDFTNAGGGSISQRQMGAESARQAHLVTASLPAASQAGTLLVAAINSDDTPNKFTAPAGWIEAVEVDTTPDRRTEIWYYPSNPGGITSATFAFNPATINGEAQLSEWNGVAAVAPLDQTGTFTNGTTSTTSTTSTAGALAQTGELVITNMGFNIAAGQTYTRGAGWNALTSDVTNGFASEYRVDLPAAIASETVTTSQATQWANVIAAFKPSGSTGSAVLDPGLYYFNGSGFLGGGGGICLNGGSLLARDVTLEFVNQAGLSSGTCVAGGGLGCVTGACKLGSDPAGALADTSYSWFSAPCSQDPSASPPDASCLGASSWCPTGDRSCWNLLVWTPAASTGQLSLKGGSANQWLLGSVYWSGTCTVAINGDSTIAGSLACGTLSISAGAGAGTAVGGDYGVNTATVEAILVE
ncbi:MAG TPA: pilus assembly protein TadG-related protein [Candidatus Dormibacteraeota bacterium]|nr:pilus assembly protein TadG-related protein [Candidatus Dormibacteraeota bacterium]